MGNVVCCWELGGFLGHISRFVPLANALEKKGHHVDFILRDLSRAHLLIKSKHVNIYQAPVWLLKAVGLPKTPVNFAEILQIYGYLDETGLNGLVSGWLNLFDKVKPDLALMDYAPTALIAARILGIKRASFGSGFFVPPPQHPTPCLRPWEKVTDERLLTSDNLVLDVINKILQKYGAKKIDALYELYDVDENFLVTIAELDHYKNRKAKYWGEIAQHNPGETPVWKNNGAKKVFAYIKPESKMFEFILAQLAKTKLDIILFAPNLPAKVTKQYADSTITFSNKPLDIEKVAKECDFGLCHAGHDTLLNLLIYGKPVLIFPTQLEQYILSLRVEESGAGISIIEGSPEKNIEMAIKDIASKQSFYTAAQKIATHYAEQFKEPPLTQLVRRCEEIIHQ